MIKLTQKYELTAELRSIYSNTMADLIASDEKVVALEADLSSASTMSKK